jgi:hypothetical protein
MQDKNKNDLNLEGYRHQKFEELIQKVEDDLL